MGRKGIKANPGLIHKSAEDWLVGKQITGLQFKMVDPPFGPVLIKAIGLEGGLTLQLGIDGDKQALFIAKEEADALGD